MTNNELAEKLFSIWLDKKHPNFHTTVALTRIILGLVIITSLVLMFFNVSWWWELGLAGLVVWPMCEFIFKSTLRNYIEEWKKK